MSKRIALLALFGVFVFTLIGLFFGSQGGERLQTQTFVEMFRSFAQDNRTRHILIAIFVDLVTGVIAAMRVNVFDPQRLASFYISNVLPYVFGYMLVWLLIYLGFDTFFSATIQDMLASVGYSIVMTTLAASIIDNLQRIRVQPTQPKHDPMFALPPENVQG